MCSRLLLLLSFIFASISVQASEPTVVICVDSKSQWAPYTYREDDQFKGASIDTISAIFSDLNVNYELKMIPWARVMTSLKHFPDQQGCEMSWDMHKTDEREQEILFSSPLYKFSTGAFFSKKHNPQLNTFQGLFAVFSYDVCGLRGYSYAPIDSAVKIKVANEHQAFELLKRGRCDMFIAPYEIASYGAKLGFYEISEDIDYVSAPDAFSSIAYAGVTRQSPRAETLIKAIDEKLKAMAASGELEKIFKQYLPTGTGLTSD